MPKFSIKITGKTPFGGESPVVVLSADKYRVHHCGALELYNTSPGGDELVQMFSPNFWTQVTCKDSVQPR